MKLPEICTLVSSQDVEVKRPFFFETFTGEIFSQKEEFVLWKVIGYEDELGKHEMRR